MKRLSALLGGLLLLGLAAAAVAGADPTPGLALSLDAATVGQSVDVTGHDFPSTSTITVQLCGDGAQNGSTDCDVVAGQTIVSDESGAFHTTIAVRFPPVPCPCVVWALANTAANVTASAPLGVVSAPYAAPTIAPPPAAPADVQIVSVSAHRRSAWRSWFGLPSDVDLSIVVRNPGTSVISSPVVTVSAGRGPDPTGFVQVAAQGPLGPGESRTIDVVAHRPPLSVGATTYKVTTGTAQAVVARTEVRAVPFGLIAIVVLVAAAVLVLVLRRRRHRVDAPADPAPAPPPLLADLPLRTEDAAEPASVALEGLAASAANDLVHVTFTLDAPDAQAVSVCGEFNDWSADASRMQRADDGSWTAVVPLRGGQPYRYRFLVDGEHWVNDEQPDATMPNDFGSEDSVVVVGFDDRVVGRPVRIDLTSWSPAAPGRSSGPSEAALTLLVVEPEHDEHVGHDQHDDLGPGSRDFWSDEPEGVRSRLARWAGGRRDDEG